MKKLAPVDSETNVALHWGDAASAAEGKVARKKCINCTRLPGPHRNIGLVYFPRPSWTTLSSWKECARARVCRPFGVVWPARIRAPWLDYCVLTPVLLLRLRAGKGWRCRAVSCGDDLKDGEFSCGCWFALRPFWFVYGHLLVEIQSNPRAMVTVSRERQIAYLFDISLD